MSSTITPVSRKLLLIDLENLLGERHRTASPAEIQACIGSWLATAGAQAGDIIVAACHPGLGFAAKAALPGHQVLVRHGRNGADLALLEWGDPEFIARRFHHMVLGSGDGAFTELVQDLMHLGVIVRLIAPSARVSRRLSETVTSMPVPA